MQVYGIVLDDKNNTIEDQMNTIFPNDNYKFNDLFYLIRTKHSNVSEISEILGLMGKETEDGAGQIGVVFRLVPAHSGFADDSLWKWLLAAYEDEV